MFIKEADGWRGSAMTVINPQSGNPDKVDREFIKINGKWVGLPRDGYEWIRRDMPVVGKWDVITEFEGKFLAISNDPATIAMSGDGVEWDVQDITEFDFEPTLSLVNPSYPDEVMLFAKNDPTLYMANANYHGDWHSFEMPVTGNWVAAASDGTSNVILEGYMDVDGEELPSDKVFVLNEISGGLDLGQMSSKQYWTDITYSEPRGIFLAVAKKSNVCAVSRDGLNWVEYKLPRVADWCGVRFGNGTFVCIATDSDIVAFSSAGRESWEVGSIIAAAPWSKLEYDGEIFLAMASPHVTTAWSRDGLSWSKLSLPVNQEWNDLHSLGGRFVAVGGDRQVTDIAASLDFNEFSEVAAGKTIWVNQVVKPHRVLDAKWFSLTGSITLGW